MSAVGLSDAQKGDLARLWPRHVDECLDRPGGDDGGTCSAGMDDNAFDFVCKLHVFLVSTIGESYSSLLRPTTTKTSPPSQPQREQRGCDESATYDSLSFLFHGPSSASSGGCPVPRLSEGRHVIQLDHRAFTSELRAFLHRRQLSCTEDFRDWLHRAPERALGSLGCAVGLAVVTMWRRSREGGGSGSGSGGESEPSQQQRQQRGWSQVAYRQQQLAQADLDRCLDAATYVVRFNNVTPTLRMVDVKTSTAYHFVSVRGHVTKARPRRLRVLTADFQCAKCGEQFNHRFTDGRYNVPDRCVGMKCRSKTFSMMRSTATYVDCQELRLQEAQDETTVDAGRTPRQMDVEVTDDLVDSCNAGDVVTIAGIVRAVNSAIASGKTGKRALETSTYKLYLTANSVVNMTTDETSSGGNGPLHRGGGGAKKARRSGGASDGASLSSSSGRTGNGDGGGGASSTHLTRDQLEAIAELAHADHRMFSMPIRMAFPFDLLVRSLCPSIVGHNLVKAGILLGLLGGTPPSSSGLEERVTGLTVRSNSHVLIVGDPGMGKSQMLLAASQIAARGVYVGGNTASTTGLTVSLTKEAGGEVGIEAGALVLSDQGVCCIDEFDKMGKNNQDGLLEAMEQQQISIAKAGVVASLPSRCSVIAAANPKSGKYNMGKSVAENLSMATPLLSRFDLVFILQDNASEKQDHLVSSSIMDMYRTRDGMGYNGAGENENRTASMESKDRCGRVPLETRLQWVADFQKQPLPFELVKDYVSYAREYCKPKMTPEAAAVLQDYFMKLRHQQDSVPITTRQLEALIRLSQARAKACLRDYVLRADAEDVVELMLESVKVVHMDERGDFDKTRGGAGGKSKRLTKKKFVQLMRDFVKENGMREFSQDDMLRVASKHDLDLNGFNDTIEGVRGEGYLIRKANGMWTLAT